MPEYPDIVVYIERLEALLSGDTLTGVRMSSPFLLRSVEPPLTAVIGRKVVGFERIGKRIVFVFDDRSERPQGSELFLVLHLMIAGRLHWKKVGAKPPGRVGLCCFDFTRGTLVLTEASKKKRASLHVVGNRDDLQAFARGGVDVFEASHETFAAALRGENHTLKRSLTDPRLFDGIGNAYSDEILHRARLSPLKLSQKLTDEEVEVLHQACIDVLREWTARLSERAGVFPAKVTAFQPEMAVHGKYKEPCPVCQTPVQRIRYADNETNYCPTCQNEGRLLADRAISRLLKQDWPRTLEELEELKATMRQ